MIENGDRIAYLWDEVLTEWYVNDARVLEHGYTIECRPSAAAGPLTLQISVRGDLEPEVESDGRDVRFVRDGSRVVDDSGLVVFDAAGFALPARFETVRGGGLRLKVDDADARYPLTIDPIAQQACLKAMNAGAGDFFGASVAAWNDTVVIGAPGEDGNGASPLDDRAPDSGAAYVFVRSGSSWILQAYLKASDTGANDAFGESVAIHGDTIVVGAWGESSNGSTPADDSAPDSGAAYVFVRNGASWLERA